ncbi:MAG TPA: CocE/NonD family hydrolase [Drouetiella sp.]
MSLISDTIAFIVGCAASFGMTDAVTKELRIRPKDYGVRVERSVKFATNDGTNLSAEIFHPVGPAKTPTILVRAPISQSPDTCFLVEVVGRVWAERGYTAVIQGTRGRFGSGGDFYPMKFERQDGIETLRWLRQQPWFNGQVLGWGGSAFGQTEWSISDQTNPKFNAMEIYFASSKFHDMFYQGNAFALYSAVGWTLRSHGKKADESAWLSTNRILRAASGFPMSDSDRRDLGVHVTFFQDWIKHKDVDNYWREIDGDNRAATTESPALFVAGWYDPFLKTELSDFQQVCLSKNMNARRSRLVIGPWSHARDVQLPDFKNNQKFRPLSIALSIPWFDAAIRDQEQGPEVQLFTIGSNRWRKEKEWPLARTKYTNFYLSSDKPANSAVGGGVLSTEPATRLRCDRIEYDPLHPVPTAGGAMIGDAAGMCLQKTCEERQDVLVYTSQPLTEDLEITGPVKAVLNVSTDVRCTDFTAKVVDVYPDGRAYNLCDGIIRRSYEPAQSTDEGAVEEIEIDLTATSNVFRKRHRIRLDVSSSNFPRFDRNPNTGRDPATETHPVTAHQRIYSGNRFNSRLILPVIPNN